MECRGGDDGTVILHCAEKHFILPPKLEFFISIPRWPNVFQSRPSVLILPPPPGYHPFLCGAELPQMTTVQNRDPHLSLRPSLRSANGCTHGRQGPWLSTRLSAWLLPGAHWSLGRCRQNLHYIFGPFSALVLTSLRPVCFLSAC